MLNKQNLVNFGGIPQSPVIPSFQAQQFFAGQTNFVNGQFSTNQRIVQQQFTVPPPTVATTPLPTAPVLFPQELQTNNIQSTGLQSNLLSNFLSRPTLSSFLSSASSSYVNLHNPANVQFIDDPSLSQTYDDSRSLFKRNENSEGKRIHVKRINKRESNTNKVNKKRALIALSDGSFVDDKNIADTSGYFFNGLSQFGGNDYQNVLTKQSNIDDEIKEHDREAAEDEVKSVMTLCSSCDIEPFIGAVALAWKDAKVQIEHALKGHSVGSCGKF